MLSSPPVNALRLSLLAALAVSLWTVPAHASFLGLYPNPSSEPHVSLLFLDEEPGGRVDVFDSGSGRWYGYLVVGTTIRGHSIWRVILPGPAVLILRFRSADGSVVFHRAVVTRGGEPDSHLNLLR